MQKMAADFPTMWAENRGFLAYPIRTRNCIFTQLHCRRRHKKPYIDTEDRTIEAIRCEGAARCIKRAKTTYRVDNYYR